MTKSTICHKKLQRLILSAALCSLAFMASSGQDTPDDCATKCSDTEQACATAAGGDVKKMDACIKACNSCIIPDCKPNTPTDWC